MNLPINYNEARFLERRKAREAYATLQDGLCAYCGFSLSGKPDEKLMEYPIRKDLFPQNFFTFPVHLHHDHETGVTQGAVHARCNAILWQYHGE